MKAPEAGNPTKSDEDEGNLGGGTHSDIAAASTAAPSQPVSPNSEALAVYEVLDLLAGPQRRSITTTLGSLAEAAEVSPRDALVAVCMLQAAGHLSFEPNTPRAGVTVQIGGAA